MPYKREGANIYTKASGVWKLKQTCASEEKAKGALRLLDGIEHGLVPTGKPSKREKNGRGKRR